MSLTLGDFSKNFIILTIGLLTIPTACTDASLELLPPGPPPVKDNKLKLHGDVCTLNPESLVFPMRVVFLVDCSESMEVNDPPDPITGETGREKAVRETATDLLTSGGDVEISVVRFSSEAQPITAEMNEDNQFETYFTSDLDYILAKLLLLRETDRTTNFTRALSEGYAEMRDELMHAEQESLALSTYQVIMITDGIPDAQGNESAQNSAENILDAVDGIMELGQLFHVGKMKVNTALISSGNIQVDTLAENLLEDMAEVGDGTFRAFATGSDLNFMHLDLSALRRIFSLKTLVVQNLNAFVDKDQILSDSDGDGLADVIEFAIGSSPFTSDSDGDGCSDFIEYQYAGSSLDPIDPDDCQCFIPEYCFDEDEDGLCDNGCLDADLDGFCDCIDVNMDGICDPENYTDSDGDGFFDCEERYSGTNKVGSDSDGDGLLDFWEFRFGTAPDINDAADDFDWDAVTNGEEVRIATDPLFESKSGRSQMAYRYNLTESAVIDGRRCYDFNVSNITISEVISDNTQPEVFGPAGQGYSGSNRILVIVGEVPFDDLESYARFRVACVKASYVADGNYKNPPSGRIDITDADFVDLKTFDPSINCK